MENNKAAALKDGVSLWEGRETRSVLANDGKTQTAFFVEPPSPERLEYLSELASRRRPDRDGPDAEKAFLDAHILWPCKILTAPRPGVVWPVIPQAFLFGERSSPDKALSAARQGRPRKCVWFLSDSARATLAPQELGNSSTLLSAMADLARAVAFLHSKKFACCGLSDETVLLDMAGGRSLLTGAENFWTPGFPAPPPPTRPAYAAPEFVGAAPDAIAPDFRALRDADLHALAVLFYRLLLRRHPLAGHKQGEYGPNALFIEDPDDTSARPDNLNGSIRNLGDPLEGLFLQAFTRGLRDPRERPTALQWETALETARKRHDERKRKADFRAMERTPGNFPFPVHDSVNLSKSAGDRDASRTLKICVGWDAPPNADFDLDISAFFLRNGKRSAVKEDMVFYGAPVHASNSVRILDNIPADVPRNVKKLMAVDQSLIPADVSRVDFFVTVYFDNAERPFNAAKKAFFAVYDGDNMTRLQTDLSGEFGESSACLAASLIRNRGKMALTEQKRGYAGGLSAVCRSYGIEVQSA